MRMETESPRALRIRPSEAVTMPFPTLETTPPVTKMYLAIHPPNVGEPRFRVVYGSSLEPSNFAFGCGSSGDGHFELPKM